MIVEENVVKLINHQRIIIIQNIHYTIQLNFDTTTVKNLRTCSKFEFLDNFSLQPFLQLKFALVFLKNISRNTIFRLHFKDHFQDHVSQY